MDERLSTAPWITHTETNPMNLLTMFTDNHLAYQHSSRKVNHIPCASLKFTPSFHKGVGRRSGILMTQTSPRSLPIQYRILACDFLNKICFMFIYVICKRQNDSSQHPELKRKFTGFAELKSPEILASGTVWSRGINRISSDLCLFSSLSPVLSSVLAWFSGSLC